MHLIFVVALGWLLSFIGQLPLGAMSMTATQIAVQENFKNAWKFSAGVMIVEMLCLRTVLSGVDWIMRHRLFFIVLGWLTVFVFLALGVASFVTANRQHSGKKALLLNNRIDRFWLGLSMSALNPAQIPFWFIWSSYFLDIKLLRAGIAEFNLFTIGSGIGTLTGLMVYMYGGNWLITKMNTSNKTLNKVMGAVFMIAAAAQFYRMLTVGKHEL